MISRSNYANRCRTATGRVRFIQSVTLFSLVGVIACNDQPPQKPGAVTQPTAASQPAMNDEGLASRRTDSASSSPPVLLAAPEFQLTDQTGSAFGSNDLEGCVWIANFMFTRCTATCPRQTAQFEELQRRLQRLPDWDRIRLISFTVDPENDTASRLHEYAEAHRADSTRWKFLTGTRWPRGSRYPLLRRNAGFLHWTLVPRAIGTQHSLSQ
ncbi:MAG: SCO family protein [Planctomycetaceae bacterium]|nr:SCO family protein [Planctomycetaceae bacterium]